MIILKIKKLFEQAESAAAGWPESGSSGEPIAVPGLRRYPGLRFPSVGFGCCVK